MSPRNWNIPKNPVLLRKFEAALLGHLPAGQVSRILDVCRDPAALEAMPLHKFMGLFTA